MTSKAGQRASLGWLVGDYDWRYAVAFPGARSANCLLKKQAAKWETRQVALLAADTDGCAVSAFSSRF